jgi:DNA-directed RNA polymerase specialized sigma24 family protein
MNDPPADTQAGLRRIPDRHLAALRAALSGFDDTEIAALLGIPAESVRPTLRLAAAKLLAALAGSHHHGSSDPTSPRAWRRKSVPPC